MEYKTIYDGQNKGPYSQSRGTLCTSTVQKAIWGPGQTLLRTGGQVDGTACFPRLSFLTTTLLDRTMNPVCFIPLPALPTPRIPSLAISTVSFGIQFPYISNLFVKCCLHLLAFYRPLFSYLPNLKWRWHILPYLLQSGAGCPSSSSESHLIHPACLHLCALPTLRALCLFP